MRRLLLLLMGFLIFPCSFAKHISEQEAYEAAMKFIYGKNNTPKKLIEGNAMETSDLKTSLSYTAYNNGQPSYYVFNLQSGGYVIVSSRGEFANVMAYSLDGFFNYDELPANIKQWFDGYADFVSKIEVTKEYKRIPNKTKSVSPLLNKTEWGQMWPYNKFCPVISGLNAPTGCVPTAYGQLMRYYQWPKKGKGYFQYQWNGDVLSSDFSSSVYEWDLMLDKYDESSDERSINAVALLMKDLGIAFEADYSLRGTSCLNLPGERLSSFFDYSSDVGWMVGNYVSTELLESTIIEELSSGRPVIMSGDNGVACERHVYVCDGVDDEGFFHINFGWDGSSNGFFRLTEKGYSLNMDINYKLRPEDGIILPEPSYTSLTDHFKYSEQTNCLKLAIRWFGPWHPTEYILAIEDVSSKKVTYLNKFDIVQSEIYNDLEFDLGDMEEGEYILYPLYRHIDEESRSMDWKRFEHNDMYQDYVEVKINGSVVEIENPLIPDEIEEGKVKIDNIYYELDESLLQATITYKNSSYSSYAGEITIPELVDYNGNTYDVTSIGEKAFFRSDDLKNIIISPKIRNILKDAVALTSTKSVIFSRDSELKEIGDFSFEQNSLLTCVKLPNSLLSIGSAAFQGDYRLQYLSLPSSYVLSAGDPFHLCTGIRSLCFDNPSPIDVSLKFFGVMPDNMTLYVPKDSKKDYENHSFWKNFEIFEYFTSSDCMYVSEKENKIKILDGGRLIGNVEIPETVFNPISKDKEEVEEIGHCAFYANRDLYEIILPSGISYIGDYAFAECSNLKKISCKAVEPPTVEENTSVFFGEKEWACEHLSFRSFYGVNKKSCILQVPKGSKQKYQNAPEWNEFETIEEVDFQEVVPTLVESLVINPDVWNGEEGSSFNISVAILPGTATDKSLLWESSDSEIATVDSEGNVNVLKEGTCVISVSTLDGSNLTAQCLITSIAEIDQVFADPDIRVDVFNLKGIILKRNCSRDDLKLLTPGMYILRSEDKTATIFISNNP